jgi:hypothetical protein
MMSGRPVFNGQALRGWWDWRNWRGIFGLGELGGEQLQ